MSDYKTGYGKPPEETRFKPGKSGNPKGRPKRLPSPVGEVVREVLHDVVRYRENGKVRAVTKQELALEATMQRALNGDVDAAESIIQARAKAQRKARTSAEQILVHDWLPELADDIGELKPDRDSADPSAPAAKPGGAGE